MESAEQIIFLTENELNFQLLQIAENLGLAEEVSTAINNIFIDQYTLLKRIPVDLASVIRMRYERILSDAQELRRNYLQKIAELTD